MGARGFRLEFGDFCINAPSSCLGVPGESPVYTLKWCLRWMQELFDVFGDQIDLDVNSVTEPPSA